MSVEPGLGNEGENPGGPTPQGEGQTNNVRNLGTQNNNFSFFQQQLPPPPTPKAPEEFDHQLPPGVHAYRHPDHVALLDRLTKNRILMLASYGEVASYAVAHTLLIDERFGDIPRRFLAPDARRSTSQPELELMTLTNQEFVGKNAQVLLIEVKNRCRFFNSLLDSGHVVMGRVIKLLHDSQSFLVLSVNESLIAGDDVQDTLRGIELRRISHLHYLLTDVYGDGAAEYEKKLLAIASLNGPGARLADHYQRIGSKLRDGRSVFEAFLAELESEPEKPPVRTGGAEIGALLEKDSELHRAVVFVATHLPDLNQLDFDRFIQLLLFGRTVPEEKLHQVLRPDGKLRTIREQKEALLADRWSREGDRIFRECHLHTVTTGDGSRVVEFTEPGLRNELRDHLIEFHPWYFRQQCQRLQDTGILFAAGLAPNAVGGLVQLFVERAIADPSDFDSVWLLQLVYAARVLLTPDDAASESPETWLSAVSQHQRRIFVERLAALIREMLQHTVLRGVVDDFFRHLIDTDQHEALLDVVLDLAPRLRFFPHFDPLTWMRKLLDHGDQSIRLRTATTLVEFVHGSGPRIYELLESIRQWPEEAAAEERNFSRGERHSSRIARDFVFWYCAGVTGYVAAGVWPSQHPLFYALSSDRAERRKQIEWLVAWILDSQLLHVVPKSTSETPIQAIGEERLGHVAALIEHWAFVLEGSSEHGPAGGVALFKEIASELEAQITPLQRTWLQRRWQRCQEELTTGSAPVKTPEERKLVSARRKKLESLRLRFANPIKPRDI